MAKQDFNPADFFISTQTSVKHEGEAAKERRQSQNYNQCIRRAKIDKAEPRSRHLQLLVKPSLYSELQIIATLNKQSINNLIEEVVTDYLQRRKDKNL